jgi:hypothetical protein
MTFLRIPVRNWPGRLVGEIQAAGEGSFNVHTSTCLRPPFCGGAFSHSIRKEAGPFELTPTLTPFRFEVPIEPYEQGYLYIHVSGTALFSHVSGVLAD